MAQSRNGGHGRRAVLGAMAGAVPILYAAVASAGTPASDAKDGEKRMVSPALPNKFIYVQEIIDITVKNRKQFLEHFLSWGPISRKLHNMRLCGVWGVNGSTHRWPQALVLWELDGIGGYVKLLSGEYAYLKDPDAPVQDHYTLYYGQAPEGVTDTGGLDRLLAPTAYTPSIATIMENGVKGIGYLHETFTGPPGSMNDFLARLGTDWRPVAERLGLNLVGAYRTMLLNDSEGVAIWAIPQWDDWANYELALHSDPEAVAWRAAAARAGIDWDGRLLNPVNGNPLNVGKIP